MGKFTVTEKEAFNDCGWRWDFNSMNRLALEPVTPLKALWLGTLVHKSLDLLAATTALPDKHPYTNSVKFNPFDQPLVIPQEPCDTCGLPALVHVPRESIYELFAEERKQKLIDLYTEKVGTPPSYAEQKDSLDTIALGRAMFSNYLAYYKEPLPPELEYISTEQSLIVQVPGTEHCECAYKDSCDCGHNCRPWYFPVDYTFCTCARANPTCSCRQCHYIESTLDGLVRRKTDGGIFILENKTFTFHPRKDDLERNHQFMGYTWAGNAHGLDIQGVLYNGLWKRAQVPKGKTMHDLFTREYLDFNSYQIAQWGNQARIDLLKMGDPTLEITRNVHAVGGCNGVNQCNFKALCDARYQDTNYTYLLSSRYQKREKTSIFAAEEVEA
jgi:hypothetical protein